MGIKGFRAWFESQFPDAILDMPVAAATSQDTFDHVLIDMNQLLHVALRKSRSDGHGLIVLMRELDACLKLATPRESLVLAMDGAPSAAKLATQRKRRYSCILRTDFKIKKLEKLSKTMSAKNNNNTTTDDNPNNTSTNTTAVEGEEGGVNGAAASAPPRRKRATLRAKTLARKARSALAETRTLCITPGTDFMKRAEQAILYWAWQRLSSQSTSLSQNNVKIFVSPSTVAGEGEVKLLEWIYSKSRRGGSIAILGGDSDLVLEGLVIPVSSSHNVFVLLPDGSKRYLCVSLWETTRTLALQLPMIKDPTDWVAIRTDLVLLLILNGNDYLPKLRGSSGFNKLYHAYLRLQREWRSTSSSSKNNNNKQANSCCMVNPDTLQFNIPFCKAFFGRLAATAPNRSIWMADAKKQSQPGPDRVTPLSVLRNYVAAGYLPNPVEFVEVTTMDDVDAGVGTTDTNNNNNNNEEDNDEDESDEADEEEDEEDENEDELADEDRKLVRLLLGKPGSEDFYTYEMWFPKETATKIAQRKLAAMALEDLMGMDSESGESGDDEDGESAGITSSGYQWEIRHPVACKTDAYLYGLLWNLQTYQDGICADYAFNYGKRFAPTADEIVKFLDRAQREGRSVGLRELSRAPFSPSVSAGVSCLAALPSTVKHLVPEPYRWLADESVESIYTECMSRDDNVFDLKKFERLCEEQVAALRDVSSGNDENKPPASKDPPPDGRRILMGDHYWTVISKVPRPLSHPFDPPAPFSERLSRLRPNNRIRVSRFMAVSEPRPRSVWGDQVTTTDLSQQQQHHDKDAFFEPREREILHSDPGPVLSRYSVEQVPYKVAYPGEKQRKSRRKARVKMSVKVTSEIIPVQEVQLEAPKPEAKTTIIINNDNNKVKDNDNSLNNNNNIKMERDPAYIAARMTAFRLHHPPSVPAKNLEGQTALACLKQLEDALMIGPVVWETVQPSTSEYASFDPAGHELVKLKVSKAIDPKNGILHETLEYEQDREVHGVSRQVVKQHIASLALCDVVGPKIRWNELTFKDLKGLLVKRKTK